MKIPFLSLLMSAVALGWGVLNHRRASEVRERLENVRNSHYRFVDQTREQVETLQKEIVSLRRVLRTMEGGPLFHPDMTVQEALEVDPRAADILGAFHIGGCSSCAVSPEDTLRYAAEGNGRSVEQLVQALNRLPGASDEEVEQLLGRRPNVQLTL